MKSFVAMAAFAAGTNALVGRTDNCCFHLTSTGDLSGDLGQIGDGQVRIGDNTLPQSSFCIDSNGGISDSSGRGCIITPPTTQFQCDEGATPTPGFSVLSSGQLEFNNTAAFIACQTGQNGGRNVYTTNSTSVTGCSGIQLNADSCSGSGPGSGGTPPGGAAPSGGASPGGSGGSPPGGTSPGGSAPSGGASPGGESPGGVGPSGTSPGGSSPSGGTSPGGTSPGGTSPGGTAPSGGASPGGESPGGGSSPGGSSPGGGSGSSGMTPGGGSGSPGGGSPGTSPGGGSGSPSGTSPGGGSPGGGSGSPGTSPGGGSGFPGGGSPSGSSPGGSSPGGTSPGGGSSGGECTTQICSCPAPGGSSPGGSSPGGSSPGGSSPGGGSGSPGGGSPGGGSGGGSPGGGSPGGGSSGGSSPGGGSPGSGSPGGGSTGGGSPSGGSPGGSSGGGSPGGSSPGGGSGGTLPARKPTFWRRWRLSRWWYQFSRRRLTNLNPWWWHSTIKLRWFTANWHCQWSNGTVTSTVSSVFNFDIPASDTGKTCSLVFLFPKQQDLETSSFTFSGDGKIDFAKLSRAVSTSTTLSNLPPVSQDLGTITVSPGNSYVVSTFPCPSDQSVAFEMKNAGSTELKFFEDFNPSPLGLFITVC
ncbi:hypothetical protein N7509_013605 [Penicillium cosmopolitanum]|uniref:Ubiquitin 3 binding protein But2 C-terminal domain-containing protein n=1 Tax=Penicillium cosmopolitanum TaxID=1131564 RepID=A0A9W9VDG9_9EURO|nr:uncharacterized protein N7509_013605 [Penicillium cosmopolitanum]KAJ5376719.1 hypothetical protein N7509_013605 [Penicillium cosmopolitanum]